MLLPRLRLSRATPAVPSAAAPDPAEMGTCFGLDLALQPPAAPEPAPRLSSRRPAPAPTAGRPGPERRRD